MATTKAQQKAVNKYRKNNYDLVQLTMPKGRKAEIKAHAETHGESVNGFIPYYPLTLWKRPRTPQNAREKPFRSLSQGQLKHR